MDFTSMQIAQDRFNISRDMMVQ